MFVGGPSPKNLTLRSLRSLRVTKGEVMRSSRHLGDTPSLVIVGNQVLPIPYPRKIDIKKEEATPPPFEKVMFEISYLFLVLAFFIFKPKDPSSSL